MKPPSAMPCCTAFRISGGGASEDSGWVTVTRPSVTRAMSAIQGLMTWMFTSSLGLRKLLNRIVWPIAGVARASADAAVTARRNVMSSSRVGQGLRGPCHANG